MPLKRILCIVCLTIASLAANAEKVLVLGGISGSVNHEIGSAILSEAYNTLNYKVEFRIYPAKRSVYEANNGFIDGEVQRVAEIALEYPNLIKVPVPILELVGAVYSKEKVFEVKGWDSIKPYVIGIRRGVKYAEVGTKGMNVVVANSEAQQLNLLSKGRVDVIVSNPFAIEYYLESTNLKGIKQLHPPITRRELYHYLHIKHKELAGQVVTVLQEMNRKGRLHAIQKDVLSKFYSVDENKTNELGKAE